MKAPSFWYSNDLPSALIAFALAPLSLFFRAATFARRLAARPYRARVPVVCVGNVVVGGAGKTPTALALARLLIEGGHKPAFVTRGYGGHGELTWVDLAQHTAQDVGDEALLLAAVAPTWAGRDRVAALRQAESHATIIIMDDGYQNPHVAPTSRILVIDGQTGRGNNYILPAGPLRQSFAGAVACADAVVMIGQEDRQNLAAEMTKPLFRAVLRPTLAPDFPRQGRYVAFAGIAHPEKFFATARGAGLDIVATQAYADHYPFDEADIDFLRLRAAEEGARLLTTEKDRVRLPQSFRHEPVVFPVRLSFPEPSDAVALARVCQN